MDRNAFRAGLFMMVSVALILAVIVGIKGIGRLLEPNQVRTVVFKLSDDVGGLRVGDDVRVGGVKQGIIRSIEIDGHANETPDDDQVRITFQLPRKYTLRETVSIRVQNTVTGASWLNIDRLGGGAVLAANTPLIGRPGAMSELLAAAGELAPELSGTVRDVRAVTVPKLNHGLDKATETAETATGFIRHVDQKVDPLSEKASNAADRGAEMMGEVRDLIGDTKGDFRGTMANLNASTGSLKERLPGILEKVDGTLGKVSTALESTNAALVDVRETVAHAKSLSASARSLVTGNKGRIDGMVASLKATGDNLKYASSEIRRSPWRLLYKPRKGEMANLNLYDSARQFAEGANDLNDAAIALRDALADPQIKNEQVADLVQKLDDSFAGFKKVEQELWEQVKE